MDVVALIAAVSLGYGAVWAFCRTFGTPSFTELFRRSWDLGWPVGVQEDDLPPSFGARARRPGDVRTDAAVPLDPVVEETAVSIGSVAVRRVAAGRIHRPRS